MIIATFTKKFTSGVLVGLTHTSTISFVSREAANEWQTGVQANIQAGKLNYALVEFGINGDYRHPADLARNEDFSEFTV